MQSLLEFRTGQVSLRRRDITEADVGALRLGEQAPALARPNKIDEITRQREDLIHVCLETARTLRLPHVPELDDVGATAALYVSVAKVERRVVKLVVLEEIARPTSVRLLQETYVSSK